MELKHELGELYETIQIKEAAKVLKKTDVKATERKLETTVTDLIDNNEIAFINNFLKKGEKIDNKTIKSIDALLGKYKKKIGGARVKTDANILMLAPILASMMSALGKTE
jgi:hypothetical protein